MLPRILCWPLYGLAFVAPFSLGLASVFAALSAAAAVIRWVSDARVRHLDAIRAVLLAVAGYVLAHAIVTVVNSPAHWAKTFDEIWLKSLLLICPILLADRPQVARRVFQVFLSSGVVVAIFSITQHFHGRDPWRGGLVNSYGDRFQSVGFFGHHLSYGGQVAILLLLACSLLLSSASTRERILQALAAAACALALVWSYARSAQLGAMAGLLGLALMADRRLRRWAMFGLALMTIAAALTPAVRDRFVSLGDGESEETRLNLWKSSVAAIADRPILGWGPGNFGRALAIHEVDGYYESRAHAHNDYLMHAVNGGALALVAALALLAIILGTLWRWRERDPLIRAALAMQLALAVAGLFQVYQTDDEVEIALYLLTGCGLALVVAASHADNSSLES